jgi:hypothetical protein
LEADLVKKQRKLRGDNHPDTLLATGNLAMTYRAMGRLKQAEKLTTKHRYEHFFVVASVYKRLRKAWPVSTGKVIESSW